MASHTTTRTQMGVVRLWGWSSDPRCGSMIVHRTSPNGLTHGKSARMG